MADKMLTGFDFQSSMTPIVSRPVPHYMIREDKVKGDFILQVYNGSQTGWSYVKTFPSLATAEQWVLDGIKKE